MPLWKRWFGSTQPTAHAERVRFIQGPESFSIAAVGESNYQAALWSIVRAQTPSDRGYRMEVTARLLPEPENAYDANAIRVFVGAALVGYLSRDDAEDYEPYLDELLDGADQLHCAGLIRGGFLTEAGSRASLGIWLDLPPADDTPEAVTQQPRTTGARATASTLRGAQYGLVRGKHYTEFVDDVRALKRHGAMEEALTLLYDLIDAVEEEAANTGVGVAPWYYEQAAIVSRKLRDADGEIAILERFAAQPHAPGTQPPVLLERLAKAKLKAKRNEPPA